MKFVFFGTPRFAEIVLRGMFRAGMEPVALVCNPDRPVGRKKVVTPPPTKRLVQEHRIKAGTEILQPEKLDEDLIRRLEGLDPDLFVVAAYAKIIPSAVLRIPRLGTIGVHPSLLPQYRGASPIQSALLNGEAETGVTLYRMDEKMDHGPVLAQEKLALDALNTTYLELEERLAKLAADLLGRAIPAFTEGKLKSIVQDESLATYTKKFMAEDGRVDGADLALVEQGDAVLAEAIVRKMNALTPEPGVWTMRDGKRVKLLKGAVENGRLKLLLTQREGEKPIRLRAR